ncbi:MAG: hypothetical protein ACYC0F_00555 [Rhodanobacter sp.]
MDYQNRLKGAVTQSLVRSLFAQAGLTVVPLGIEETIREVSDLPLDQYMRLDLPTALRKLPDFFTTNRERTTHWLVEVKYRRQWNEAVREELGQVLTHQVATWDPLVVFIFVGETPSQFDQPSSWVRAAQLKLDDGELKFRPHGGGDYLSWSQATFINLQRVQDVFPQLNDTHLWASSALHLTLDISRGLTRL